MDTPAPNFSPSPIGLRHARKSAGPRDRLRDGGVLSPPHIPARVQRPCTTTSRSTTRPVAITARLSCPLLSSKTYGQARCPNDTTVVTYDDTTGLSRRVVVVLKYYGLRTRKF